MKTLNIQAAKTQITSAKGDKPSACLVSRRTPRAGHRDGLLEGRIWQAADCREEDELSAAIEALLEEQSARVRRGTRSEDQKHAARTMTLSEIHRDPFDCMLFAQALEEELVLVTRDNRIQRYPSSVLEA